MGAEMARFCQNCRISAGRWHSRTIHQDSQMELIELHGTHPLGTFPPNIYQRARQSSNALVPSQTCMMVTNSAGSKSLPEAKNGILSKENA